MTCVDTVCYTIQVAHFLDGQIETTVFDVAEDEASRYAVACALRLAADQMESGVVVERMH